MANAIDQVISEIVRKLYDAGAAQWSTEDKAALVTAVNLSLMPVRANFPKKEADQAGKEEPE